jgi:antitoxin component of RelBE/YafQ-DinJ toxin-antitoxin module
MSEAIFLYLTQVSLQKGIPFELKMPNDLTRDTIIKYLIISSPALAGFFVCGIMGRL